MNQHLQAIFDLIQQSQHLTDEEKAALSKAAKDAAKELEITNFKLDRTEKVKRTTAILLEETIEELEQKRKAVEAQNRELEIESSLERVRVIALSMNKPDDMLDVCKTISQQLELLNIKEIRNVQTAIFYESKGTYMNYEYYAKHNKTFITDTTYNNNKKHAEFAENMQKGNGQFFELNINGDEVKEWIAYQKTTNVFIDDFLYTASSLNYYWFSLGPVALGISTYQPLKEEGKILFKRFLKVFELAYRRYLDIEQAEAQAKEARIETALERVRAIAMSMMKSDELMSICEAFFKQLQMLGFTDVRAAQIYIRNDAEEKFLNYDYSDITGADVVQVSYNSHPNTRRIYDVIKNAGDALVDNVITKKELDQWKAYLYNTLGQPPEKSLDNATELHYYLYSFGMGAFGICTFKSINDDELQILKRFRNVFSLSYQRYADIALAEAQAKEAMIETALERVRSRTLAMQKSDELAETSSVLFKQLIGLGIEPHRLYISIMKDDEGETEFWITDEEGSKVSMAYEDNLNNNPSFKKMFDGWKQHKKFLVIDMQGKELKDYFKHLTSLGIPFKDGLKQKRRIQHLAFFNRGFIGMAAPDDQPAETIHLLERFAAVFNLTFTRFNDLKIAEAHALQAEQDLIEIKAARKKAEETLAELQSTQKQLVQSEKMASLGELTAGIAHEIQNPLNFVNNFSEVSKELLDEMKAALESGDKEEAEEIANDIIQNLEKINHHGKRADAIVKGMLQHSRKSSGQKEPTDINALCDEYLRLSYHGLRAKDKEFNADFKTDFDESIAKINIVPQDIGRVLLNLFNNAFYAVNEKKKLSANGYQPIVVVKTHKINDGTEIIVSDNGNGIPQNIIDKIFQPFFTTKPTGEGTGLGLSLAYDIITKQHNGTIKAESKEGEGTTFIIQLPA